jgi:caa(3)-type oxidase subunit IV
MEEPTPSVAHRRPNYLLVFVALALMTGLEVIIATLPGFPKAPFLLTMSLIKALLVLFYFMHLETDSRWYRLIFFSPFIFVIAILFVVRLQ